MGDVLKFAVTTFKRVFDVTPARQVVTLDELAVIFTRFELKPKMAGQVKRDVQRVDAQWAFWEAGKTGNGRIWGRLERAAAKAERAGENVQEAVEAYYQKMRLDAQRNAKKDMRLWAPALYPADSRRGSENVIHLSCLVLDYDDGTTIEQAHERWERWHHILHTTWSHKEEHHKFRVIVPLAQPVRAADWPLVWNWADRRTGSHVDPACKSAGANFALPAIGGPDYPHYAQVRPGPLLSPIAEGIVSQSAAPPAASYPPVEERIIDGKEDARYLAAANAPRPERQPSGSVYVVESSHDEDPWPDDDDDLWTGLASPTTPTEALKPSHDEGAFDLGRLNDLVSRLEAATLSPLEATLNGLERLARLREAGHLTQTEFRALKKKLLQSGES